MNRDLRDWLRSLAGHEYMHGAPSTGGSISDEGAAYLERIAQDGTLASALTEIAADEHSN